MMAELALRAFHLRHPDVPITVYGAELADLPFPAEVHPHLTPEQLNALYNRSVAGLALSFTNVTLVAEEMLCAGTIPIANEAVEARACLDNPYVAWADPTPASLADALSEAVRHRDIAGRARSAAASVDNSWLRTEDQVVTAIERACWTGSTAHSLVGHGS